MASTATMLLELFDSFMTSFFGIGVLLSMIADNFHWGIRLLLLLNGSFLQLVVLAAAGRITSTKTKCLLVVNGLVLLCLSPKLIEMYVTHQ
jgi:hypothetical protein